MKLFNKKEESITVIKNNRKISEEDLVGKNYEYYKPIFEVFEKEGKTKSFNPQALLFSPFWYVYRKMTYKGAVIIGIQACLATVAYYLKTPLWISIYVLSFLIYLRTGFYGNYDYYKKIKTLKEDANHIDDKYKDRFLKDKSSVDMHMTICWIVGTILIFAMALFL